MTTRDAGYFDSWYADIGASAARRALVAEGLDLPPEVDPSSGVPLAGLQEVAQLLQVRPDGMLLDLACGRGGPGLWIARETGCRLTGIDLSPVAVAAAVDRRALFGVGDRASYSVGSLDALQLPDASFDAAVCIDSIQFAADPVLTLADVRRSLRPGAPLVLTCWEARETRDPALSPRLWLDLGTVVAAAGFVDVAVVERPRWHQQMARMWKTALERAVDGDAAVQSMHDEGRRSLATHDRMRRVLVTAVAPSP